MNAVGKSKRDILSRQLALSLLPRADAAAAAAAAGAWFEDDSDRGLPLATPSVLPVTPADDVDDDDGVSLSVVRSDDDDAR